MRRLLIIVTLALGAAVAVLLVWVQPSSRTDAGKSGDAPGRPLPAPGQLTMAQRGPAGASVTIQAGPNKRAGVAGAHEDEGRAQEDLFQRKLAQDRLSLGPQRHGEMERLWSVGRENRGDKKGIESLERLLKEYPNTNRAGCAAWELGHQYIHSRDHDLESGRERARKYWQDSIDRYGGSICEQNASVGVRAKLGLAAWVYRYTDQGMARKLLNEVIEQQQQEATPHDRTPPAVTARRLLENLTPHGSAGGR